MQLDPELYMFFTVSPHKKVRGVVWEEFMLKGKMR
jgi:hypothetical protein